MNYKADLHKIKAMAFDVDGVFTDGSLIVDNEGNFVRVYNAKDGYAIRYAISQGYHIAIITGGMAPSIKFRFEGLGVKDIFLSSENKMPHFEEFCKLRNLNPDEILFMGDDIPDIEILKHCGVACCPADAVPEVKSASTYISLYGGGKGCVRDVIEQVLKVQGKWHNNINIKSE